MTKFPEHPWREPVPLRRQKYPGEGWFTCRFCLYRNGVDPRLGLPLIGNLHYVEAHLKEQHQ